MYCSHFDEGEFEGLIILKRLRKNLLAISEVTFFALLINRMRFFVLLRMTVQCRSLILYYAVRCTLLFHYTCTVMLSLSKHFTFLQAKYSKLPYVIPIFIWSSKFLTLSDNEPWSEADCYLLSKAQYYGRSISPSFRYSLFALQNHSGLIKNYFNYFIQIVQ